MQFDSISFYMFVLYTWYEQFHFYTCNEFHLSAFILTFAKKIHETQNLGLFKCLRAQVSNCSISYESNK